MNYLDFYDSILELRLSGHNSTSDPQHGRGGNDTGVPRRGPGGRGRRADVSEPRHVSVLTTNTFYYEATY